MKKRRSKASASLHVRLPANIKRKAEQVIERSGLDASSVVRMFYFQIAEQETIPLKFTTMNGLPKDFEDELWRLSEEKDGLSGPFTPDEAIAHVRSL